LSSVSRLSYASPAPRHLHSFPTRRSSDLTPLPRPASAAACHCDQETWKLKEILAPLDKLLDQVSDCTAAVGTPLWSRTLLTNLRSEEHTSELQSRFDLVCRLLLEKKKHRN